MHVFYLDRMPKTNSNEYAYQVLKHEAILGASVLSYVKAHLFGAVHVHIH